MNRREFEQSALEHLDAVYRMAFHLARDTNEAEEIVQDVYARAFRPEVIARFQDRADEKGVGGMRSWLFTIAHNTFVSRRKKAARGGLLTDDFRLDANDGPGPGDPKPVWDRATLDWDHVDSRLKAAIDELKPQYREVLLMWAVDGLKYREIAEITQVPIGTVMSRLHRARKLLSDRLIAGEDDYAADAGLDRLSGPSTHHPPA